MVFGRRDAPGGSVPAVRRDRPVLTRARIDSYRPRASAHLSLDTTVDRYSAGVATGLALVSYGFVILQERSPALNSTAPLLQTEA